MANTATVRKTLSGLRLIALPILFFMLPVYAMGLGIDMPASDLKALKITDDWFDVKGTQTVPPFVKPGLFAAFGLAVAADLVFIAVQSASSSFLQVARSGDFVAGVITVVSGEMLLAHVESNTSSDVLAPQTARFGTMIPATMILLLFPTMYETIVLFDKKTPSGENPPF